MHFLSFNEKSDDSALLFVAADADDDVKQHLS